MFFNQTSKSEQQWLEFGAKNLTIEMVLSKKGRKIFPTLDFSVMGVDDKAIFNVYLEFLTDNVRLTFDEDLKVWKPATDKKIAAAIRRLETKNLPTNQVHLHPKSPISGYTLRKQGLNFSESRLTNFQDRFSKPDVRNIQLTSMRKYYLRLHFVQIKTLDSVNFSTQPTLNPEALQLAMEGSLPNFITQPIDSIESFTLNPLVYNFVAVTSYQNPAVTDIKIAKNPQANCINSYWKYNSFNSSGFLSNSSILSSPKSPENKDSFGCLINPKGVATGKATVEYGEKVEEVPDFEEFEVDLAEFIDVEVFEDFLRKESDVDSIRQDLIRSSQFVF